MQKFLFQLLGLLILSVVQFSFIDVAFPDVWIRPNILVVFVVLWMLRKGFFPTMRLAISLGLVFDIISSGSLGMTALFLLWCAYVTSFLSQRFLVEHSSLGGVVTAALAGFFSWGNVWMDAIHIIWSAPAGNTLMSWFPAQSFASMLAGFFLNGFICVAALSFQRRFWRHSLVAVPSPISTRG
jgi:rod shape-determining protein MreD